MEARFRDRRAAGQVLATALSHHAGTADLVVLALPRGGVPVAYEVAVALGAPLDVFLVRKLGVPAHEELAMGAVASGGGVVLNERVVRALGIRRDALDRVLADERVELERREVAYRRARARERVRGRTAIVVDDGLATGSSMRAAVRALRADGPAAVVVAVPVAPRSAYESLAAQADEIVCTRTPAAFWAVGEWYRDFSQVTDDEVCRLLDAAAARGG